MTAQELRNMYIQFFLDRGHTQISGKSLVPENDPTVLFTTAGMHPLVPYILGEEHPAGTRLVNVQKCIRTGDIDSVGDPSHLTFFEMLGNWSLGDYFKEESISMSWEFLTQYLSIDPKLLAVTVFEGDADAPRDTESAEIWKKLGLPNERIFYLSKKDNWWGPPGKSGPCGPDTEIFIDTGIAGTSASRPGVSDGKWMEIWNNVFMQYNKGSDGVYEDLKRRCVDTGMGLERTITILQNKQSVYETELFAGIIAFLRMQIPEIPSPAPSARQLGSSEQLHIEQSIRIISDHIRSSCFILCDRIAPSNIGQGYILRRLLRRAIRHGIRIGLEQGFLLSLSAQVLSTYAESHPELIESKSFIEEELEKEEARFTRTLAKGEQEFAKIIASLQGTKTIPGDLAFKLYDTYGFPVELSMELAKEQGYGIDLEGFERAFQQHQQKSRMDENKTFKGGLADHSEKSIALHTATHLLHEALCRVLGDHVQQKGSNITEERLRFDFIHPGKMTEEELAEVEKIVNEQIQRKLEVTYTNMTLEEAKGIGAKALFTEKYDNVVKVYTIGDFSTEVCGGPHVHNTSSLGKFKILKEQSSSQGVRRIKALLVS